MRHRFQKTEADARHSTGQQTAGAPTIRDIARLAGVSIATVSRTLNNRGYVAPETRARVLEVARAEDFQLNTSARLLVSGHTGHVSIAVPELGRVMGDKDEPSVQTYYPMDVLAGVTRELYERNLYATLIAPPMTHGRELTWVDRMIHERSDGLILVAPDQSQAELQRVQRAGIPFVVIEPMHRLTGEIPIVSSTNARGAREMTEHLLSLGHRRIGAITGGTTVAGPVAPSEERLHGYRAALAAAGIPIDPALIADGDFRYFESGTAAATALLDRPDPPTAIFAFNDTLASGAIRAARERGLSLPDELSIAGFDNSSVAAMMTPAVTTMHQQVTEMGRMAVDLLLRFIGGQPVGAMHVEIATKLIVRESTARPRRG